LDIGIVTPEKCQACKFRKTKYTPVYKPMPGQKKRPARKADIKELLAEAEQGSSTPASNEAKVRAEKEALCATCIYHIGTRTELTCDYLKVTGKRRPCPARQCREAGVYVKGERKKRREDEEASELGLRPAVWDDDGPGDCQELRDIRARKRDRYQEEDQDRNAWDDGRP